MNFRRVDRILQLQLLIVLAIALGGGGVRYGIHNAIVQVAALAVLAANPQSIALFMQRSPVLLRVLLLASLALPLLQLVPLPPSMWTALPGRETVAASLRLVGKGNSWFPISVDRARTLVAFCGTIAPATIILVGWSLPGADKMRLCWTLIVAATAVALLGAVQISFGNTLAMIYSDIRGHDILYGTFANRNSTGLFFVVTLMILAFLPIVPGQWRWLIARGALACLLAVGVVLTQSRTSMVLLFVPAVFLAMRLVGGLLFAGRDVGRGMLVAAAGAVLLVVAAGSGIYASFENGGRAAESMARFGTGDADRLGIWEDGVLAAEAYWPIGSGMGTFDEVFQIHESLEYIKRRTAGRAHNDFIDVAIEAGLAGLLLAAAWIGWVALAALGNGAFRDRWAAMGAALALGCIAAQSAVDYPLRNQAMLCAGALLVCVLVRRPKAEVQ